MPELLPLLFLGFFLGMRHATDADHVIAVTTIVSREPSISRLTTLCVFELTATYAYFPLTWTTSTGPGMVPTGSSVIACADAGTGRVRRAPHTTATAVCDVTMSRANPLSRHMVIFPVLS